MRQRPARGPRFARSPAGLAIGGALLGTFDVAGRAGSHPDDRAGGLGHDRHRRRPAEGHSLRRRLDGDLHADQHRHHRPRRRQGDAELDRDDPPRRSLPDFAGDHLARRAARSDGHPDEQRRHRRASRDLEPARLPRAGRQSVPAPGFVDGVGHEVHLYGHPSQQHDLRQVHAAAPPVHGQPPAGPVVLLSPVRGLHDPGADRRRRERRDGGRRHDAAGTGTGGTNATGTGGTNATGTGGTNATGTGGTNATGTGGTNATGTGRQRCCRPWRDRGGRQRREGERRRQRRRRIHRGGDAVTGPAGGPVGGTTSSSGCSCATDGGPGARGLALLGFGLFVFSRGRRARR